MVNGIFDNRFVIHHGIDGTSTQAVVHQITSVKCFNSEAVFIFDCFKETLSGCSVFNTNSFTRQLVVLANLVCLCSCNDNFCIIVSIRHGENFFTFFSLCHSCHDSVSLASLNRIDRCVKSRIGHLNVPSFNLSDFVDNVNINSFISLI